MDDCFKNAMDTVVPEEGMIERLINSEVKLFRHALMLLCWGLVLTGFNINIEAINLAQYTTWAGAITMALGLWMLRTENRQMSIAYRCSLILLPLRTVSYWLSAFPEDEILSVFATALTVMSFVILVVQVFFMFSALSELAKRFENEELAAKLKGCFWLYISLSILVLLLAVFPVLMFATFPYAIFVLIRLPVMVSRLKEYVPLGERMTTVNAINKRLWLSLSLYIVFTFGGAVGCLCYVNMPRPKAIPYVNTLSPQAAELYEKLQEHGMPQQILNDLPEDEILLYEGIYKGETYVLNAENMSYIGGSLEIISFYALMPTGKVRQLYYYHWHELPRHTYVDLLAIPGSIDILPMSAEPNVKGLSLYDMEGKTYRQELLNEYEMLGVSGHDSSSHFQFSAHEDRLAQIQFRLLPDADNQRGYIAADSIIYEYGTPLFLGTGATYVHQKSFWNIPNFNPINNTAPYGYSSIHSRHPRARAFWDEFFYFNLNYEPEGWIELED